MTETQPRGVLLPPEHEPEPFAARAADLGYDRLWVGELWGADAFVQLARAADADIGLGTSIVNVYSRTPAALAQAAATLDDAARGEVVLGLGTSTEQGIESLHGLDFARPIRRLHETAELAGEILHADEDERVSYDGELVGAAGAPGLDADVPVYTAALGSAARRATGRVADGWLPHNVPFDRLGETFETIAEAARERGRDPDAITVAPYVPCAVSDDAEEARAAVRGHLAYYVGSGEGYRRAVAQSFPDAAERVSEAWRAGDRETARERVTDAMVDALGVAGTPSAARSRFEALCERDVVDAPVVVVPNGAAALATETVEALAPATE